MHHVTLPKTSHTSDDDDDHLMDAMCIRLCRGTPTGRARARPTSSSITTQAPRRTSAGLLPRPSSQAIIPIIAWQLAHRPISSMITQNILSNAYATCLTTKGPSSNGKHFPPLPFPHIPVLVPTTNTNVIFSFSPATPAVTGNTRPAWA